MLFNLQPVAFVAYIATFALMHLPGVVSQSPFIIADDRVRSLDIAPVLGRGYSIMTNTFMSTCLMVDKITVPSYNYDYFFTEIDENTNSTSDRTSSKRSTVSKGWLGAKKVETTTTVKTVKTGTTKHIIYATMKIERYYASLREQLSPLADDAATLLGRQDYVGFFKACGPNYIRSIRRAQEVVAYFSFETTSTDKSDSFTDSIKGYDPRDTNTDTDDSSSGLASSTLTIDIVGFGMGLSQEGSGTLIATNLKEYTNVMKFAFKSMTQTKDSHNIGMVYGMEVVPWVNNLNFQFAAKVATTNVIINIPRRLIPNAVSDGLASPTYTCPTGLKSDKYHKCCEPSQMFDPLYKTLGDCADVAVTEVTDTAGAITTARVAGYAVDCVCKPTKNLDKTLIKDNMANNGEFVARLDTSMRYKLAQISSLEKCISAVNAVPTAYNHYLLKQNDAVKYDESLSSTVTLLELKMAVDPLSDFGMIRHLAAELDDWIEMFYSKCLAELYGMGIADSSDTSYFMAYPWYQHKTCMKLSCIVNNMRWDREDEDCVPSLITGNGARSYLTPTTASTSCATKDVSLPGASATGPVCKNSAADLKEYADNAKQCWNNTQEVEGIDFLVNYFCNPTFSGHVLDPATAQLMEAKVATHCRP